MELKTCEYCGTAYDARLRQCPLCGRAAAGQTGSAEPERTAAAPEKAAQSAPAPERPAPGRRLRQEPGAPKAPAPPAAIPASACAPALHQSRLTYRARPEPVLMPSPSGR